MKLFECQHCGQPLYFENTRCESCGRALGYLPAKETITALENARRRLARARRAEGTLSLSAPMPQLRRLQLAGRGRQSRTVLRGLPAQPHHSRPVQCPTICEHWRKIEVAKHRLFYTLLKLRLPLATKTEDPDGPGVRLPRSRTVGRPVMTGHDSGLITHQSGGGRRCRARAPAAADGRALPHAARPFPPRDRALLLGPPGRAIRRGSRNSARCSATSGRTTRAALQRHYANGPPPDWQRALRHRLCQQPPVGGLRRNLGALLPHGRHAGDGARLRPARAAAGWRMGADLATAVDFDPHTRRSSASSMPGCR